jgi:hypothetical protein
MYTRYQRYGADHRSPHLMQIYDCGVLPALCAPTPHLVELWLWSASRAMRPYPSSDAAVTVGCFPRYAPLPLIWCSYMTVGVLPALCAPAHHLMLPWLWGASRAMRPCPSSDAAVTVGCFPRYAPLPLIWCSCDCEVLPALCAPAPHLMLLWLWGASRAMRPCPSPDAAVTVGCFPRYAPLPCTFTRKRFSKTWQILPPCCTSTLCVTCS